MLKITVSLNCELFFLYRKKIVIPPLQLKWKICRSLEMWVLVFLVTSQKEKYAVKSYVLNNNWKYMKITYVHYDEEMRLEKKKFRPVWDLNPGLISTTSSILFIAARIASISFLHCSAHMWFSDISNYYSLLGRFIWIQH